ncbi:hypothetical protein F3681_01835 [Escherichia coli]|nr:hypothetical protein [Escherichia coli]
MGTGNTGGMRGAKRKQIYSSPFEAEWAVLNHKRIFYDSDIHSIMLEKSAKAESKAPQASHKGR